MVSLDSVDQPSIFEQARSGDLRAIAYWINSFLVPQDIFVRVGVTRSGSLHLLVEFERQPDRERLVRFICHRLCRLKSDVIDIVRIAVRPAGTKSILWTQSIRLLVPVRRPSTNAIHAQEMRSIVSLPERQHPKVDLWEVLPPKLDTPLNSESSKAPNRARMTKSRVTRKSHPLSVTKLRMRRRRSIALGGSAVAAFLIGCGIELSHHRFVPNSESFTTATGDRSDMVTTVGDRVSVKQQLALNPADPTVTLTFGSDSALGSPALVDNVISGNATDLAGIEAYRQADVVLTNLDNPLIDTATVGQTNSTDAVSLQTLTAGGVDVVNLAGDRLLQGGDQALGQALDSLKQSGILSIGAGRNPQEARRPEILDVKGQRIAYLGYSDSDLQAAGWSAGLNPAINDRIAADIQAIRHQVDWVIVNYHWSKELAEYPGEQQINMARFAIDQGADLVVGHHSDVLQGAEIYKGRAIAYSLGSFIFADGQNNPKTDYDTAVLKVSLSNNQMRLEFLPVEVKQSRPEIVSGEKAQQILQYIQQASGLFDQPMQSPITLDLRSPEIKSPVPDAPATSPDASTASPDAPTLSPQTPSSSTPFTSPSGATADPRDAFTTYPKLPTGSAKEISNEGSGSSSPLEVQDSFDRNRPASAEPINYKQSGTSELKRLPQEMQELQPQLDQRSPQGQNEPQQMQPAAPQESDHTPAMVPATIDTIANEPVASPSATPDSHQQEVASVQPTLRIDSLAAEVNLDTVASAAKAQTATPKKIFGN